MKDKDFDIRIRKAKLKDCKEIYRLSKTREVLSATGDPVPLSYFKKVINRKNVIFLVAEIKDKVIGYTVAQILDGRGIMWWLLSVNPNYRNRGIGKKLERELERECKKRKIKWIIGYVHYYNKNALAFHKKNGFSLGQNMIEILKDLK